LTKATQLGASFAPAWHALGRVEFKRKRHEQAVDALNKAASLDPKSGAIAADRCQAQAAKSPDAEAMRVCEAAIRLDAKASLPRYVLLKLKAASGDCSAAKQLWVAFVKLPGLTERVKQAAEHLVEGCTPSAKASIGK